MEFFTQLGLTDIAVSAFFIVAGAVFGFLYPALRKYLKALKDETDSNFVAWFAEQAVVLMDERFKGESGNEKFEHAVHWVAARLEEHEIYMSVEEIRGAIQKGFNSTLGDKKGDK